MPASGMYDVIVTSRIRQIDAIYLKNNCESCQISSRSDLKRRSLRLFWRWSSQQEEQDE